MERPLLRRRRQGLKREWTMAEAGDRDEASASEGEVIENDMKRLRLAQDYDEGRARSWQDRQADVAMDVDGDDGAPVSSYERVNAMLREFHFLRQLRKFQSEHIRERASYFERRTSGAEYATPYLQEPRN